MQKEEITMKSLEEMRKVSVSTATGECNAWQQAWHLSDDAFEMLQNTLNDEYQRDLIFSVSDYEGKMRELSEQLSYKAGFMDALKLLEQHELCNHISQLKWDKLLVEEIKPDPLPERPIHICPDCGSIARITLNKSLDESLTKSCIEIHCTGKCKEEYEKEHGGIIGGVLKYSIEYEKIDKLMQQSYNGEITKGETIEFINDIALRNKIMRYVA